MAHTRRLNELTGADDGRYGGKSAALGELLAAGIPVPPGFALATSAFTDFLAAAGLTDAVALTPSALRAAAIPTAVRDEVGERYAELAVAAGDPSPPVAVRSSALGEDSAEATFAGQQDTYLWVRGADDVCVAVRDCWASLYGEEAVSYRRRLGGAAAHSPAMGVTVQLMVDAAVSGVLFTCNPVTGDPSMVAVNASWGLGLAVVGGEVTPDDYLVSKVTGEVVREQVNAKTVEYRPAAGGRGTVPMAVDGARRSQRCLGPDELGGLVELGKRIEAHFGSHQDVEWAVDGDGALYVLQARPVTALPRREAKPMPTSALGLVMERFGART